MSRNRFCKGTKRKIAFFTLLYRIAVVSGELCNGNYCIAIQLQMINDKTVNEISEISVLISFTVLRKKKSLQVNNVFCLSSIRVCPY